jgi:hypothetical protein
MESTDLIPLDGDVAKITKRAEEFGTLHESLQRNLPTYLTLTMDAIAQLHQKVKAGGGVEVQRQNVSDLIFPFFFARLVSCFLTFAAFFLCLVD